MLEWDGYLIQYNWHLYKKGKFGNGHIEKPLSEDEDRDQGDASIGHGTLEMASRPLEGKQEQGTESLLESSERRNSANTLISDLYPPGP